MTDKEQTIIDGVYVNGCNHYGSQGNCTIYGHLPCSNFSDCNFKQLARKTQECEELKEELATYKKILDDPEYRIALIDVRTGEREVWRKLGRKAERYRKALYKIKDLIVKSLGKHEWAGKRYNDEMEQILLVYHEATAGKDI